MDPEIACRAARHECIACQIIQQHPDLTLLRIERGGKGVYQGPFEAHCSEPKDIVTGVSVRSDGSVAVTHATPRVFFKW